MSDKVTIYTTSKAAPHYAEGTELKVHPVLAKTLIAAEKATDKAPSPKK